MARDLQTATEAQSLASLARPVALVELDWGGAAGIERLHSWVGAIEWNGYTWQGVGNLGGISPVEEGAEFQSYGVDLSMSGLPEASIATALDEDYQGRPVRIYVGFLGDDYQLVADPAGPWTFDMDVVDLELGESARAVLRAHNRARLWDRANVRRYTDQDQQDAYPGDLGMQFVSEVSEKELVWPAAGQASAVSAPPPAAPAPTASADHDTDGP